MSIVVHDPQYLDEQDRATVRVNDIVVDVIENEDGSVYVEFYPYSTTNQQVVLSDVFIDRYTYPHPSVRLMLARKPDPITVRYCDTYDPITKSCTHTDHNHD